MFKINNTGQHFNKYMLHKSLGNGYWIVEIWKYQLEIRIKKLQKSPKINHTK